MLGKYLTDDEIAEALRGLLIEHKKARLTFYVEEVSTHIEKLEEELRVAKAYKTSLLGILQANTPYKVTYPNNY